MNASDLNAALLAAHDAGDHARLVTLYEEAAKASTGPEVAYFLTQAWIFALEAGDPKARALHARLRSLGCA